MIRIANDEAQRTGRRGLEGARDLVKVFCWDGNGFAIYLKKLAKGCFPVRFDESLGREEIDAARLLLLLEGIELQQAQWRPRWQPPTVEDEGRRSTMTS